MRSACLVACILAVVVSAQELNLFKTTKGNIVLKTLPLEQDCISGPPCGTYRLRGTVANRTDTKFLSLQFIAQPIGPAGERLRCAVNCKLWVTSVLPNSEKSINDIVMLDWGAVVARTTFDLAEATYEPQYQFSMVKPKVGPLAFEDQSLRFEFALSVLHIGLVIGNKTDDPVKIDWNLISYVDPSGRAHRIIHSGIKSSDKDAVLPPSIIPPTARIDEVISPADTIWFEAGRWRQERLFPETVNLGDPVSTGAVKDLEGRHVTIFIPVEVNGRSQNYTFVFRIDRAAI